MLNSKFLITLIGLAMAIFALCKMDFGEPVVENWWGNAGFVQRAQPAIYDPKTGRESALGVSVLNEATMAGNQFVQVPNYQAVLSPRFSNLDYGANIKYNLPSRKNMGVPCDPLAFGKMAGDNNSVKENYGCDSGACNTGAPTCGKGGMGMGHKVAGGYELPSNYANGNYWSEYNKLPSAQENVGSNLPVGTMTTMDTSGNEQQFVTFNRLMFSNRPPSRKYASADWIRGDLAITPCNQGWFSVYPDIVRDVNPGAMGVLAGAGGGGASNNATMDLLLKSTAGTKTTFGGVDLSTITPQSINQNAQVTSQLSAGLSDLQSTAFP